MFEKKKISDQEILDKVYDFVLDPTITARERKIGLMGKADLEKGRYIVAVVNQVIVSLQQEGMKNHLTPVANTFYEALQVILNQITPIGTNRGSMLMRNGYLVD